MVAVSTFGSMASAVLVSMFPKSAGSIFRIKDDQYAPKDVRRATILREGTTLGQVAVYSAAIERGVDFLKGKAHHMLENGEKNLFTDAIQLLEKNRPLFLAGLAFTSNISAEMISRKLSPRNVWKKPETKSEQDKAEPGKAELTKTPIQAAVVNVDGKEIKEIPVEIEICQVTPSKRSKSDPRFEAAAKPQPIPFTSSSPAVPATASVVNPFQVKNPLTPVARNNFSV